VCVLVFYRHSASFDFLSVPIDFTKSASLCLQFRSCIQLFAPQLISVLEIVSGQTVGRQEDCQVSGNAESPVKFMPSGPVGPTGHMSSSDGPAQAKAIIALQAVLAAALAGRVTPLGQASDGLRCAFCCS
jgi:hypothetical protein